MSTLILSPFIILFYGNEILSLKLISISYSLLFAVICSVLAYFIYFKILVSTGAGNLLICTIIIPPSAILLNAIIIGELININEFIGLASKEYKSKFNLNLVPLEVEISDGVSVVDFK